MNNKKQNVDFSGHPTNVFFIDWLNEWMNLTEHPWRSKASCWAGHNSCVLKRWANPIESNVFSLLDHWSPAILFSWSAHLVRRRPTFLLPSFMQWLLSGIGLCWWCKFNRRWYQNNRSKYRCGIKCS